MEDKELTHLLAVICGVGNTVRKTNLKGRERIFPEIYESNQDSGIKNILSVFASAYMGGYPKQVIWRKLVMQMRVSEANADDLCNLPCLEWEPEST